MLGWEVCPTGDGKLLTGERGQGLNLGIESELVKTEKLSVAPVFPLQVLSACGEVGLMTIIRW